MRELNDTSLDTVIGGSQGTPAPTATGGTAYTCPLCRSAINASTRDTSVTCPNVKCRASFKIINGKLVRA